MKRLTSILLALALALSLVPAALAAEAVTPTPPPWCPEEEYPVFSGSAVYELGNWAVITQARSEVLEREVDFKALTGRWDLVDLPGQTAGVEDLDFGVLFERTLIQLRLLEKGEPCSTSLSSAIRNGGDERLNVLTDQQRYLVLLWTARGILREKGVGEDLKDYLPYLMKFPQFSLEALTHCGIFTAQEQEGHLAWLRQSLEEPDSGITVVVDSWPLHMDVPPKVRNQRTMVPIRAVAEAIGADVAWVQETKQIVMTRAGSTVTMTLDSTTADIDGKAVEMDVAPFAVGGRTLIPARYVAEFFDQKVDWDGTKKQVTITEDKSVAEGSNLEAWALPMGGMLKYLNSDAPYHFGVTNRGRKQTESTRRSLESGWSVQNREDLINTVLSMTMYGHDATFREMAADVKLRTPEERAEISATSDAWPEYMWEYTEYVDKKWGDRGIMAWDLFRMSNLVQWGYEAGYLTYAEALELLEPAATILCENFTSWDEAYENYLDGYHWWAREDVMGKDVWETFRGQKYRSMRKHPQIDPIFNDALFETGVIPLPGSEG